MSELTVRAGLCAHSGGTVGGSGNIHPIWKATADGTSCHGSPHHARALISGADIYLGQEHLYG